MILDVMVQLHFDEYGGVGSPLIILHGLFGSSRNWAGVARSLSENFRVYAIDLRNHGSSGHAMSMTYEEMAADVAHFIAERNIENPFVLGHSMGGKVGMWLALSKPTLLKGLIVVDIAPVTYGHDMLDYIAAMEMLNLTGGMRRSELEEKLRGEVADPSISAFLMTNLERASGGFQWRVNLAAITRGMREISAFSIPEGRIYRGPTVFIAGSKSAYIRVNHRDRITSLFPIARIVTIKDANHWVHADKPDALLETVQAFMRAVR
jgi:pimeloyl-ACP methyl ester carboxylesterase